MNTYYSLCIISTLTSAISVHEIMNIEGEEHMEFVQTMVLKGVDEDKMFDENDEVRIAAPYGEANSCT